ncbi:dihydrolipoyllysine-residue (2-methylpropanoyl)transferase [Synchytrium endobioticum]|uniref:Dihydrolipoamide acetyltransferase component of pyruvate dehydrogenase complex n=1 Tax=Synchytrium endobioticum TaxID=286115 RepID=A0A507CXB4_9FUNG|nr:dihydrolipoyllysine-residue (2-methylpropanoyl)transferase [Synchytrium endobioticum]
MSPAQTSRSSHAPAPRTGPLPVSPRGRHIRAYTWPPTRPLARPSPIARRSFFTAAESRALLPYALADIGEGIAECEIIQWFVKPGDRIEQFDKICEVQSDKASVEITSRYDGLVTKLYYDVGAMARVGKPLVDIDTGAADTSQGTSPTAAPTAEPTPTLASQSPSSSRDTLSDPTAGDNEPYITTTPAVRRLAKEQNVDLAQVRGTGKNGRIMKEDVVAFTHAASQRQAIWDQIKSAHVAAIATPSQAFGPEPLPQLAPQPKLPAVPPGETVPLSSIQRAMFKQMTKSLSIPHFGYSDEIELSQVALLRAGINDSLSRHNDIPHKQPLVNKITYMPIFIKAMSMALKEFPIMNSTLVDGADASSAKLKYNIAQNVGVAMDTPGGLIVPNIKNVESKSILSISKELDRLKDAGRRNALSPSDFSGGTITISNIGNVGGTLLHPVIPPNELCIGAIGRIQRLPRVVQVNGEEKVVAKDVIHVSFNADHRVIDGATMARFVSLFKAYLEAPGRMVLQMV